MEKGMTKNIKWLAAASIMALASCSDNAGDATYTVGNEDNAIALTLGMDNSLTANNTRSGVAGTRAEGTTTSYVALKENTAIRMRVEGTWTGHTPEAIVKTSDAKAQAAATGTVYNAVGGYSPMIYWDDYGTADPANTAGKTKGLSIYAVAVDGTATAPDVKYTAATTTGDVSAKDEWGDDTSSSNLFSWSTEDSGDDGILQKDLLVSNNLSGEGNPGRLTFDEHKAINRNLAGADAAQSRLVFKHVLSKITFKLKAADGFKDYQFANVPKVELTRSHANETETNYCYVAGTVNVRKGEATPTTATATKVTLKKTDTTTDNGGYQVVTEEAVVYPGTPILSAETDIVARVTADGNVYYVTAAQIKKAIDDKLSSVTTDKYLARAGYNYVFNVTVKKTAVNVTATVEDWQYLEAEEVAPVINVSANVGAQGSGTTALGDFSFYRMADEEHETTDAYNKYNTSFVSGNYYTEEVYGKVTGDGTPKTCTFYKADDAANAITLYWPDHQTHYHFRGICPRTADSETGKPLVVSYNQNDGTTSSPNAQGILVKSCQYNASTFPCNLMIGAPEITANTMCGNQEHTNGQGEVDMSQHGVCARTGNVNLNFRYMMSQVAVTLSTTPEGSADRVDISGNTVVELEGAETEGYVDLHTRTIGSFKSGSTKGYTLTNTTTDDATCLSRHDCIIPQSLNGLKFKITVKDSEGNILGIYRTSIADIQVYKTDSDGKPSVTAEKITAWEAGKKYAYYLKLSKTKVVVTATLTDWETKKANTDIWL